MYSYIYIYNIYIYLKKNTCFGNLPRPFVPMKMGVNWVNHFDGYKRMVTRVFGGPSHILGVVPGGALRDEDLHRLGVLRGLQRQAAARRPREPGGDPGTQGPIPVQKHHPEMVMRYLELRGCSILDVVKPIDDETSPTFQPWLDVILGKTHHPGTQ